MTHSRLSEEMVLAIGTCVDATTSKASSSSEVRCKENESNGTMDAMLDELKAEFENLSTLSNFNRAGSEVRPVSASEDRIVCEMIVGLGHVNAKGTLHGGQTAALTDIVTARAIGQTVKDRPMASIELSVSYMHPVKLGDVIEITATVLKVGRNVAFSEAEFRRKSDGKLAAKGRHTVAILPKPPNSSGTKVVQY